MEKIINLLSDLVVFDNYDFDQFLKKLIRIISEIIPVDACLLYFYDREQKQLILIGSKKPHINQIGKIILQKGEGVTGWAAEHKEVVVIAKLAFKDPRFKSFKELPEDSFEAFMSVPILDSSGIVGVINLHNRKPYKFSKSQVTTIKSLVKIIASAFVKVALKRKLIYLENSLQERKLVEKAKGLLMKHRELSEDESYKLIRKEAMNRRKSMKEIAESIIIVFGT